MQLGLHTLDNKVISHEFPAIWPCRFEDLSPSDLMFAGTLKNLDYRGRQMILTDLEDGITLQV